MAHGAFDGHIKWAWAFDKAIEALAMHPGILELAQGRPQLSGPGERVGVAITLLYPSQRRLHRWST